MFFFLNLNCDSLEIKLEDDPFIVIRFRSNCNSYEQDF